jgi:hypothetical protein
MNDATYMVYCYFTRLFCQDDLLRVVSLLRQSFGDADHKLCELLRFH